MLINPLVSYIIPSLVRITSCHIIISTRYRYQVSSFANISKWNSSRMIKSNYRAKLSFSFFSRFLPLSLSLSIVSLDLLFTIRDTLVSFHFVGTFLPRYKGTSLSLVRFFLHVGPRVRISQLMFHSSFVFSRLADNIWNKEIKVRGS